MSIDPHKPSFDLMGVTDVSFNLATLFPESTSNKDVATISDSLPRALFETVTAVVQLLYVTESRIPDLEEVMERCPVEATEAAVYKILKSPDFYARMQARGINWPEQYKKESGANRKLRQRLTPQQVFAMQIVLDPTNHKALGTKLRAAGVSYSTWQNWLREPLFAAAVRNTSEQMLGDNIATVHSKLVNKAEAGDTQAMRLFYEISGRHNPQAQQIQDLNKLVMMLLEVITRYVTSPVVLANIQNDFATVLRGDMIKPLDAVPANYEPEGDFFEFNSEDK